MLDPQIPWLENALNPRQVQAQLQAIMPGLRQVATARLVRHKPGRRALIKYYLTTATGEAAVLGKIRAKGTDRASHKVQQSLWQTGWQAHSGDRLSVPEPLGLVPAWHMTLQRQVPGRPATELLTTAAGIPLAQRIAHLARKLHRTPVPTTKTHTLADELRILCDRLPQVAEQHPPWQGRIDNVLAACAALTQAPLAQPIAPTGIHRDFYADQILVNGDRLWLVDLDLYCQGSPALDMGNMIAHITEQSLRESGDPQALGDREAALRDTYLNQARSDGSDGVALTALTQEIERYTLLSLVRHIHISTRIARRRPYTAALLALCEARLASLAR